jgi:hypothetical protein
MACSNSSSGSLGTVDYAMTDEDGAGWRRLLVVWSAQLTLRPSSLLASVRRWAQTAR